jgi:hypothetical protein
MVSVLVVGVVDIIQLFVTSARVPAVTKPPTTEVAARPGIVRALITVPEESADHVRFVKLA